MSSVFFCLVRCCALGGLRSTSDVDVAIEGKLDAQEYFTLWRELERAAPEQVPPSPRSPVPLSPHLPLSLSPGVGTSGRMVGWIWTSYWQREKTHQGMPITVWGM